MPGPEKRARRAAQAAKSPQTLGDVMRAAGVEPSSDPMECARQLEEHGDAIWEKWHDPMTLEELGLTPAEIKAHKAAAARIDRERQQKAKGQPVNGTMDADADMSGAEGIPSGPEAESKPTPKTPRPSRPFVPGAGAGVLNEVEAIIRRYVILPNEEAYIAVTLWAAATHGMPAWEHATRLVVISAVKGCGKTRLFEVLQPLSEEPLSVSAATTSAITRSLEGVVRTVFHDEADTVFGPKAGSGVEKLRGIYNAGFAPGAGVLMSERDGEEGWTPRMFEVFAMVALASKGVELPDTIMDRAVVIRMRKKLPSETVANFRQKHIPEIRALGRKLGEWVGTVPKDVEPETPLQNREADLWEPLLILADAAGGEWPTRARKAAVGLTDTEDGIAEEDRSLDLLRDIKRLWPKEGRSWVSAISTSDLLALLHEDDESSWDQHEYGRPITSRQLADLLRGYSIAPKTIKVKQVAFKGYRREWFKDISARYLDQ